MPSIGARCHELRVQDETVTWRLVYRIEPKAIVVVEVFTKKTQTTPRAVIDTCQKRLRAFDQGDIAMEAKQRKNLAKMGGRVATVQEFLGLSDAEVRLIDLRIQLTRELRERRTACKVTQAQLAKLLGTSQPRVAAMEADDPQTSLEALLRALIVLGATPTLKLA
jgi:DNA-binding XRE family transcriptional regulator